MQVIIVEAGTTVTQRDCKLCSNRARPGEAVIYTRLPSRNYMESSFVVHVDCMRALLHDAPESRTPLAPKAQIQALRDAAIAAGAS